MNKKYIILILLLVGNLVLWGESDFIRPVNASLWTNVTSDHFGKVEGQNISINVLSVSKANLYGTSMSLFADVRPLCYGAQFSVGANVLSNSLIGVQFSAGANIVKKDAKGYQLGLYNQADRLWGKQLGVVNFSAVTKGTQLGLVNISTNNILGLQMGVINIASHVSGVQFGLINIADSNEDIAFGVINIIKNGYYSHNFWVNEQGIPFYGFRHGTNNFYMELSAGIKDAEDPVSWMGGAVFGSREERGFLDFDINLGSYTINEDTLWEVHDLHQLNQCKATIGLDFFGLATA